MAAVKITTDDTTCRLRLNRPAKLNALDHATYAELRATVEELADRPRIRVLVISGEGRAFSAGVDLDAAGTAAATAQQPMSWTERRHALGGWQRLLELLERIPQVTVASVHGHCVGGAALLAAACDLRIGADDLQVRIPELAIGIPLTWAGIPRLAREVGLPLARDLVMTGRTLHADEALTAGYIQRLVPRDQLDKATDELVDDLLAMPAGPLALTRSMFSALGRQQLGSAAWADADLLGWSASEPESHAAAVDYASGRARPRR